jgi:hypothetical protein
MKALMTASKYSNRIRSSILTLNFQSVLCKRIFLLDFKEVQERVSEHQKQKDKFRNNGAELNTESDKLNKSAATKKDLLYKMKHSLLEN